MFDVGDERVGVGGHVCAEKARFVCEGLPFVVLDLSSAELS